MTPILFTVLFLIADPPARGATPRPPSPFAPSLPQLTDEEEEQLDRVVHRFILSDIGQLKGKEAAKAVADFQRLGPEAIFALIRGLNKAANIESSCPVLIIAKKIARQLRSTNDVELLEFARENIGVGVTASRHMGVLKQLRAECILRKRVASERAALVPMTPMNTRSLQARSLEELAQLAQKARGPALKPVLRELEKRDGDRVLATLAKTASAKDKETRQLASESLESYLSRQSSTFLKEKMKDERPPVRLAATRVVADKKLRFGPELIELLLDDEVDIRQTARRALVKLSGGKDFGPQVRDDSPGLLDAAARKWRAWWKENGGK